VAVNVAIPSVSLPSTFSSEVLVIQYSLKSDSVTDSSALLFPASISNTVKWKDGICAMAPVSASMKSKRKLALTPVSMLIVPKDFLGTPFLWGDAARYDSEAMILRSTILPSMELVMFPMIRLSSPKSGPRPPRLL